MALTSFRMTYQLPIGHLVILFINVVFYAMASTAVFSFLPKLVKSFGVDDLNIGYYAGIVASSLFVGRLFFSMTWGLLTDTLGKKRCAMMTGIALMVTTTMFGFSWNLYWTVATRFLQGCSMGQIIVAKAILADICDDTQMSLGMSMVMTAFSSGIALGPSIGGFLVFPDELYPGVFSKNNVFSKYSVLLPNVVIVVGLGVGVVLTQLFIPSDRRETDQKEENNGSHLSETDHLLEQQESGSSYGTANGFDADLTTKEFAELSLSVPSVDAASEMQDSCSKLPSNLPPKLQSQPSNAGPLTGLLAKLRESKFAHVFKVKECLASCVLYGLYSIFATGFGEIFPLLASTGIKYHGMGFSTSQIGIALMSVTLILIVLQVTLLPKLTNKLGAKKVFICSALAMAFLSPLLPAVALIRKPAALWCALLPLLFLLRCFIFTGYLAINIFVNNSVGPELLGSANGMAMTFASVGRLIGPLVTGSIFSWSLRNIKGVAGNEKALGFPLNQFFTFFVFSLWLVVVSVMVTKFPVSMNFKKVKNNDLCSDNNNGSNDNNINNDNSCCKQGPTC